MAANYKPGLYGPVVTLAALLLLLACSLSLSLSSLSNPAPMYGAA